MIETLGNLSKESFSFEMEDTYRIGDEIEVLAETFPDIDEFELLTHVKTRVDEFVGDAPQFDDLTMLDIKWLGTTQD